MTDEHPLPRIVLFTNSARVSVATVRDLLAGLGYRLVGVVTTPGPRSRRSDEYLDVVASTPPGIDVIVSNHPQRWRPMLEPLRPDLIVSSIFPWRIPDDVVALAPLGGMNFHDAPLPKYRGPNPVGWAIRNGDERFAVTFHRLGSDFDTGPILAQDSFPLTEDDDIDSISEKIGALVAGSLLRQALDRIARGDPGDPQDDALASYAPQFEPEWRFIDWNTPARHVHRQVRSWIGDRDIPRGAVGTIDGVAHQIVRTRLSDRRASTSPPGTVIQRDGDTLLVQCADMPLLIVDASPTVG